MRGTAVAGAVLLLAACGAPSPDDVIPGAAPAQDGGWCALLTDEDVAALVGADQADRVRQSGELRRTRTTSECSLYLADGGEYSTVATVRALRSSLGEGDDFGHRRILPVLGEDGRLVDDGTTTELSDGVYRTAREVVTWMVLGADEEPPGVAEMTFHVFDDVPGELSADRLTQIGQQMQSMVAGIVDWRGPARPFQVEELAPLLAAEQGE